MRRRGTATLALAGAVAASVAAPAAAADVLVYQRPATSEIVVAQADGSSPRVVARGQFPVVSPDGRRIAFLARRTGFRGSIRVVAVGGGRPWTVVRRGWVPAGQAGSWSHDGRRLAVGSRGRVDAQVVTMGRRVRRRIGFAGDFGAATFSPDGSRLLVERLRLASFSADLVLIRLRGGRRRVVAGRTLPVWGAGGLATRESDATKYDPGTYAAIYVASTPTTAPREVFRGEPPLGEPIAWSADGEQLLLSEHQSGPGRAILLNPATGAQQTLPAPFESRSYDRSGVAALSRDGAAVLGEAGGDVVAQDAAGTVTVLARGATTPSWTR